MIEREGAERFLPDPFGKECCCDGEVDAGLDEASPVQNPVHLGAQGAARVTQFDQFGVVRSDALALSLSLSLSLYRHIRSFRAAAVGDRLSRTIGLWGTKLEESAAR